MNRKRKTIIGIGLAAICLISACTAAGAMRVHKTVENTVNLMQPIDKEEIKQMENENLNEETVQKLRDNWTVAVFGLDSRDNDGLTGTNSDVIMLMNLNGKTGAIKLVSIYRDTCLKTGKNSYRKANSAYAYGGPKQAVSMLNENLDLKIDDYIAVNWKAVADAVNILGGVDLEITDREFKYINSFITETVQSTGIGSVHLKQSGINHLDGVQTVAYCRLRLMDDDFKRTERQQKVISLLLEKAKKADYATLNQLIVTILPQTASSIDTDDLYAAAGNILKLKTPETSGFPSNYFCRTVDSAAYVFPNTLEKNVATLHQFLYGTKDYEPSQAVKNISVAVAQKSQKRTQVATETILETKTEGVENNEVASGIAENGKMDENGTIITEIAESSEGTMETILEQESTTNGESEYGPWYASEYKNAAEDRAQKEDIAQIEDVAENSAESNVEPSEETAAVHTEQEEENNVYTQ